MLRAVSSYQAMESPESRSRVRGEASAPRLLSYGRKDSETHLFPSPVILIHYYQRESIITQWLTFCAGHSFHPGTFALTCTMATVPHTVVTDWTHPCAFRNRALLPRQLYSVFVERKTWMYFYSIVFLNDTMIWYMNNYWEDKVF